MTAIQDLQRALGAAYTIERELGGGGMSRVFVATETKLDRSVVIKVIAPDLLEGMSAERFAREVRLAAKLQQANIVPVLTAGDAGGRPYYTMPFVRGESLRTRMATGAPIPVADAIHILRDVARALAAAHSEGIVHRDIKPENVLLSGGAAVVTDFGIAKAIDVSRAQDGESTGGANVTLTRAGSSLGTPAYMAPEQAAGDPGVDHRADIYAWGLIAWELIAGRHPFAGKTTVQALVAAQLTESPEPLASARAEVSPALSDLVRRCLEKDPARRPPSVTELLASLDQAVSTGSRGAVATTGRGRGTIVGVAAIVLVVIAAALVTGRIGRGSTGPGGEKSLAVIPFASSSGDTTNAYLGEGIADEVTNALSQIPGVRLAGRSSSARFAGKGASTREVGTALGVGAVLDGTVRRVGDQIRVLAELTNVNDGLVIWHENYERPAKDIFVVQDEIARAIAGQLQVTLAGAARSGARGTSDAAAYEFYLKGLYLYRRRGPGITDAIAALDQATVRDSTFARAWATLSAVARDRLYFIAAAYLGWAEAEDGRIAEGLGEERRGLRLDPTNTSALAILAFSFAGAGVADSAKFYAHRILEVSSVPARVGVAAYALARAGEITEAKELVKRLEATPRDAWTRWTALAVAYTGLRDSARTVDAMEHAAVGDGDLFPLYVGRLRGDLPTSPRVDAVLRRYHLDPARFPKRATAAAP